MQRYLRAPRTLGQTYLRRMQWLQKLESCEKALATKMTPTNDNRRQRVIITGGGGSIGSEIARQMSATHSVTVVDNGEFNLYRVGQEVPGIKCVYGDVRDRIGLARIFHYAQPDLVIHAAALKHVPICEDNPSEAVLTNVLGTRNAHDIARQRGAKFLLVSTDKAVRPTTVLGATKRAAEALVGHRSPIVRFGNVVGSSGSVVPLFEKQIAEGGPVTVTHPDVTRYMMPISDAVRLVISVARTAVAGIHVLDMGAPVRIDDLARRMIGGRDIDIVYTGLRPGEKMHEELSDEELLPSGINGVGMTFAPSFIDVQPIIDAALMGDDAMVRELLFEDCQDGYIRDAPSGIG